MKTTTPPNAPRLLPLGDTAWTVEFGDRIDPETNGRVLGLLDAVERARDEEAFAGIVNVVPTFRSLTVHYDPFVCDGERLGRALFALAEASGAASREGRRWRLPVCFDGDLAPDLDDLAQAKGLTRDGVIELLTDATFRVYMIGFMPGFPYMGGLPAALEMPRLSSPRKAVPARSLAVAGAMCAVYPWESPGGWRLLGRTPIPMFSLRDAVSPSLLAPGDRVNWRAVERAEFVEMEAAALADGIPRDSLLCQDERS
ncbi:5-oxoprolinase subunit PxpB [Propionivibrio sp.]|uniref:5-oxoprolinase subunit PxpB n=1 Tax=Propionivibrio sp. TaxID=2212460 RepID=UPI0039E3EC1A